MKGNVSAWFPAMFPRYFVPSRDIRLINTLNSENISKDERACSLGLASSFQSHAPATRWCVLYAHTWKMLDEHYLALVVLE